MTDGKILIENLLCYARDNLHTAEEDCRFLRMLLYRRLDIVYNPSEIPPAKEEVLGLASLYREVSTYVIERELTKKYEKEVEFEVDDSYVVSSVFGLITPLSSYLNRTFKTFREKLSAKKACDFFYETLENGAFVPHIDFIRAETKDKQDKRDVPFHTEIYSAVSTTGVPDRAFGKDCNYRYLSFDFEDKRWNFSYVSEAEFYRQGFLTNDGKSFAFGPDVIDGVFDFCEYIPEYFAAARIVSGNGGYFGDGFFTGEYLPVFGGKTRSNLQSDDYPDVEIGIVDYPLPVIRLSSFNRNTLSSLFSELIATYRNYAPSVKDDEKKDDASGKEPDGVNEEKSVTNNAEPDSRTTKSVTIICRIAPDNRYSADIIFGEEEKDAEVSFPSPYDRLFKKTSSVVSAAGRFNLTETGRNEVLTAVDVLTKKIELSDYSSTSVLYNDVMKIIEKNGFGRDAKKAEYEINECLYTLSEEYLSKKSTFTGEDGSDVPFKTFLSAAGIK